MMLGACLQSGLTLARQCPLSNQVLMNPSDDQNVFFWDEFTVVAYGEISVPCYNFFPKPLFSSMQCFQEQQPFC